MVNAAVETMLGSQRAFAVAAAGCGKTELLGLLVADQRSGRQLVLTHTHAGVAAIEQRLAAMRVPHAKFHLDTIAGWCLRYSAAYPGLSGVRVDAECAPDWDATYHGAERVCRSALGRKVLCESYDGVLVDEYQDCTLSMHAVIRAIGDCLPYRGVGDPLQTIFGFRGPCVSWSTIQTDFEVFDNLLNEPWRWRRPGRNAQLGAWLVEARSQLQTEKRLELALTAPVTWIQHSGGTDCELWAAACRKAEAPGESVVAILRRPRRCKPLAQQLAGRWPIVERFDDPDLLRLGSTIAAAEGSIVVSELVAFVASRMTKMGTALRPMVDAISAGRGTSRFSTNKEHAVRLEAVANNPTPANVLAWLDGVLQHREWWLYRRECVFQLRAALRECLGASLASLPATVAAARKRARHRGRQTQTRTIGTPLLVKGLEFDHAVVLWDPERFSSEELYVAITRGAKSLTIVSRSRTLLPEAA